MNATPTALRQPRQIWTRLVAYGAALVIVPVVAFIVGVQHFNAVNCSGANFDGECDVAGVEGMIWALGAFVLVCLVVVTWELLRVVRRRRTT